MILITISFKLCLVLKTYQGKKNAKKNSFLIVDFLIENKKENQI